MKSINYLVMALSILALPGCSPDNSQKASLFEEQRNALEKAKAVETTVLQQTQEMQKNMEKQTQ